MIGRLARAARCGRRPEGARGLDLRAAAAERAAVQLALKPAPVPFRSQDTLNDSHVILFFI